MKLSDSPQGVPDVQQEILEDELVIYHPEKDQILTLNGTAAFIWTMLDGNVTLEEIAREVAEEHGDASIERIQDDVLNFAGDMLEKGLIETD